MINVALSDNLEKLSQDSISHFSEISPEQILTKSMTARINKSEQWACTVIITFQDWEINPIKSVPFKAKILSSEDRFKNEE